MRYIQTAKIIIQDRCRWIAKSHMYIIFMFHILLLLWTTLQTKQLFGEDFKKWTKFAI